MSTPLPWWKTSVFYQIYPRSFQDSNGDGLGDLDGVRARLPELAALGVDVLWLSPVHPSPQKDFGYDISDYDGIDPAYGDQAGFDRLLAEAQARGMRVILDLVVNHTSDQHPWFQESRKGRDNPYRDWYLWRPGQGRRPPNNWASVFGGSAWAYDPVSAEHYLHLFLPEQPDLNWRNPAVVEAITAMMRRWMDRGVAGFRMDVYNCYRKHPALLDNPPTYNPLGWVYPYLGQRHVHDQDQPDLVEILGQMRAAVDPYDGVLLGETLAARDYAAAGRYAGPHALHLAFHFGLLRAPWKAPAVRAAIQGWLDALGPEGWPTWVLSNHDFPRAASRIAKAVGAARAEAQVRNALVLLLMLQGTPTIYYGEEIGAREQKIPRSRLQDPVGRRFWPFFPGRDGCRAPMAWTPEGGFTTGDPWLPENADRSSRNVAAQQQDPGSLWRLTAELLRLRKAHPALHAGEMALLPAHPQVVGWTRRTEEEAALILVSWSGRPVTLPVPEGRWTVACSTSGAAGRALEGAATLGPDEAVVALRA